MKMADEGFQLRAEDELQSADFPASSLASLQLRDEAAINESTKHMVDNPEPHSVFPVMMSSPLTQSEQQADISTASCPEPSPTARGKVKRGYT